MLLIAAGINMLFNSDGQPMMIGQWELPITEQGVHTSLTLSFQLLLAIILSMVLTFTTTPRDLTRGLERLARPLKRVRVPVEEAAVILLLAMRFVPLLQQELRTTVEAQKSRGVEFGQGGVVARSREPCRRAGPRVDGYSQTKRPACRRYDCPGFSAREAQIGI